MCVCVCVSSLPNSQILFGSIGYIISTYIKFSNFCCCCWFQTLLIYTLIQILFKSLRFLFLKLLFFILFVWHSTWLKYLLYLIWYFWYYGIFNQILLVSALLSFFILLIILTISFLSIFCLSIIFLLRVLLKPIRVVS